MLTPRFEAEQNERFVILNIRTPYIKISDVEIDIDGSEFKFHCHPYFLWLQFSGEIVENGEEKAQYDVDTGKFVVHIPKRNKGEHFKNLEMLTTLLANRKEVDLRSVGAKPKIEIIDDDSVVSSGPQSPADDEEETFKIQKKEFDWNDTCVGNLEEECSLNRELHNYGFANQHSGVFLKLQDEVPAIIDVPEPDKMSQEERRIARIASEQTSFNADHYLADLFEDCDIQKLICFKPSWAQQCDDKDESCKYTFKVSLSDDEKYMLKDLPNKEYLLDHQSERSLYLGLIDIIFAYAYNHRTTQGENSVESAWTICKISSTLSWLENFSNDIHDVLYVCIRRSLCYPLYRNWELANKVMEDTKCIFRLGRTKLLQCLLSIRQILDSSEPYYILNNLYVTDYCVWIQNTKSEVISSLADQLDKIEVDKASIGFDLLALEEAAYLVLKETNEEAQSESEEEVTEEESEVENSASGEEEQEEESEEKVNEEKETSTNLTINILCEEVMKFNTED